MEWMDAMRDKGIPVSDVVSIALRATDGRELSKQEGANVIISRIRNDEDGYYLSVAWHRGHILSWDVQGPGLSAPEIDALCAQDGSEPVNDWRGLGAPTEGPSMQPDTPNLN